MMRLSQKIKKGLLLIVFCLTIFSVSAQRTFKYEGFLNRIDSTGFYKVTLWPEIVSKSKDDLSDIRLMDPKGNYIPYITQGNMPKVEKQKFIVFPRVAVTVNKDTGTSFIAENIEKQPVSSLWVKLQNTAVTRLVNLSGSDDLKNWYAIEEDIPLQDAVSNGDGTYLQSLSFPTSNYHYLKLLVNDKNKAPVKFLEAGEYVTKASSPFYFPVFFKPYIVNRIKLSIAGTKYYKRNVSIYQIDRLGHHLICSAELNSNNKGDFFISVKANKLELQIDNGDNMPLTIDDVKVYQAEQYIVSYLEKGKLYKLFTGDVNAAAPDYDLKFFIDSIRNIQGIAVGPLMKNATYNIQPNRFKREYPAIIWAAIIVVLALLSLLTWKMIGEVNNKKVDK
jgi:hypothetical protein